jgi:hypothetical protein
MPDPSRRCRFVPNVASGDLHIGHCMTYMANLMQASKSAKTVAELRSNLRFIFTTDILKAEWDVCHSNLEQMSYAFFPSLIYKTLVTPSLIAPKNASDILRLQDIPDCLKLYLDAIRQHLHKIDRVEMSWNGDYTSGAYNRWICGQGYSKLLKDALYGLILPAIEEFKKMSSFVPDLLQAGKISLQAVEAAFEREAFLFQGRLHKAPLLTWLKENQVSVCIGGGAWALDKNIDEHLENYGIVRDARSPIIVHREQYNAGKYPYEYYQQYLRAGEFDSGIGYWKGIKRGNAKNLRDIGYKKAWFWSAPKNFQAWQEFSRQRKGI